MKTFFAYFVVVAMLFIAGCGGDGGTGEDGPGGPISFSQKNITVPSAQTDYSVNVISTYSWEATSKNNWISLQTSSGIAGTEPLRFSVGPNMEEVERKGTVVVRNTDFNLVAEFYVTQKAFEPTLEVSTQTLNFPFEGGVQAVSISTNISYSITENIDWLSVKKTTSGITVTAKASNTTKERSAEITLTNHKYKLTGTIQIKQAQVTIPANADYVIYYTSADNKAVNPSAYAVFGANIIANIYENEQGLLFFNAPITKIGNYTFEECNSLTSISIPNSVISIGDLAFSGCNNLTSITIPESVTSIGYEAFNGCNSLTSITIPNSVTSIGSRAFSGCTGELIIDSKIVEKPESNNPWFKDANFTSLIIGDHITSIGESAFNSCTSLIRVFIPNSVTSIGEGAFARCSNLTNITIPNNVTSIGQSAFHSCTNLTSVIIPNSVTSIGGSAFYGCKGELRIDSSLVESNHSPSGYYPQEEWLHGAQFTSLVIGDHITKIGNYTFCDCNNLTSIKIPNSVTSIGQGAFYSCNNLTNITIPNSVTLIEDSAFKHCTNLIDITIPNTISSIQYSVFSNCRSLTSIAIPNSVTSIGDRAFENCNNLMSITIPNSIASIGVHAFEGCCSLKSITIPKSVTSIGKQTFYGCSSLTSITIHNSITSIGESAFVDCRGLTSVTILDGTTTIGDYAFSGCSGLTSVTIPNSVVSIGDAAFKNCTGELRIDSKSIENGYTFDATYWLDGANFSSIIIGGHITKIGDYAFYCCNPPSVTILNSVTSIGAGAFLGCTELKSITIPESVISIGDGAFESCYSLASITIPDRVTSIGHSAFYNCRRLTSIYCKPTTPPSLGGGNEFDDNVSDLKIYIPRNSVYTYLSSRSWKEYASALVGYDF